MLENLWHFALTSYIKNTKYNFVCFLMSHGNHQGYWLLYYVLLYYNTLIRIFWKDTGLCAFTFIPNCICILSAHLPPTPQPHSNWCVFSISVCAFSYSLSLTVKRHLCFSSYLLIQLIPNTSDLFLIQIGGPDTANFKKELFTCQHFLPNSHFFP